MQAEITEKYGHRARIRVCGFCWKDDKLLMVNHKGLTNGDFWAPPGGGVKTGEPAPAALAREFKEETNLTIQVDKFQFVCELIQEPLHAIELFFEVTCEAGDLQKGTDPESDPDKQIITDVQYLTVDEILAIPADQRHGIFRFLKSQADLKKLSGFYRI